jgi:hypothetical protein
MDKHIGSYPSVHNIGHKNISNLFDGEVIVEEKIDGSQLSFGVLNGELVCRSKGAELIVDAPERMFERAIDSIKSIKEQLYDGWIYCGEYLQKPKHNTLCYGRVPRLNIIVFDILRGVEDYLSPNEKKIESERLGLECVPLLDQGTITDLEVIKAFLERMSVLGGSKIEGVVIKNYSLFTPDKKIMIGKYVSDDFKEIHQGEWRKSNPVTSDVITSLIERYRTPARWQKAVNHLRDSGLLEGTPRDIGKLIIEIPDDVRLEYEDEIKEALFIYAWAKIRRGITAGMPEWYKEQLAQKAFEDG